MNNPLNKKDKYYKELQDDIRDYLISLQLQYKRFPWSTIDKVHFTKEMKFTISGVNFNGIELKNNLNKLHSSLKKKLRLAYFNSYLKKFEKESKELEERDIPSLFNDYREEIVSEIKSIEMDLNFCLNALKEINKININESEESIMEGDFTLDLLNCYESIFEDMDFDDDVFEEGANNDTRKKYKEAKKRYIKSMRSYKKNFKNNKFDDAIKDLTFAKNVLSNTLKDVKSINSSTGESILGFILQIIISYGKTCIICLPFITSTLGGAAITCKGIKKGSDLMQLTGATFLGLGQGIGAIVEGVTNIYQAIITIISTLEKCAEDGKVNANNLNIYKNTCEHALKGMIENLDKLIKSTKETKKAYKDAFKKETVKESVLDDIKTAKRAIYEAYGRGEITLEEREEFLQDMMESKLYDNYEKASSYEDDTDLKMEKFESVKELIRESFLDGEITLEECEALILKARDRILYEEEGPELDDVDGLTTMESAGPELDPEE